MYISEGRMPAASSAEAIYFESAPRPMPLALRQRAALSVYPDITESLAGGALLGAGFKVNGGCASREL